MYNRFLSSFPDIFKGYDADLSQYGPFKFRTDKIYQLQSQLTTHGNSGILNGKSKENETVNGIQYVKVRRDQYQTIIDQVNQFKNKMQKYHQQFQSNAKQIQSLKQQNDLLKHKKSEIGVGMKTKSVSVVM